MDPVRTPVRQGAFSGGTGNARRSLAFLLALALAVFGLSGLTTAATAATPVDGLTTTINFGGTTYDGYPVLAENTEGTLTIQYSDKDSLKGKVIDIALPEGVSMGDYTGNNANVKVTVVDGKLRLAFANSFDSNQGVITVKFKYTTVEKSERVPFTYTVDGVAVSADIIVLNGGDEPENVSNKLEKGRTGDFGNVVTVTNDVVTLAPSIIGKPITYTLTFDTKTAQPGYDITDTLPAGMVYGDTFTWQSTTWDEDGLNKETATTTLSVATSGTGATGQSFTHTLDVPGPSRNTLVYTASVADEAARLALQAKLQADYDAKKNTEGAQYKVDLVNKATLGGTEKTNTVTVGGRVPTTPKPGFGNGTNFDKSADWTTKNIEDGTGGTILPVDVTWTMRANLKVFTGTPNDWFKLDRNVVITDTLPAQATWKKSDASFISATGGLTLAEVANCPATPSAFANTAVGSWCVTGQTLMVNVGQDNTTDTLISAKASITTTSGLGGGWTPVEGGKAWTLRNTAKVTYSTAATPDEQAGQDSQDVTLVDRGDGTNGYNDPSTFTKTADNKVAIDPTSKTATVRYTLRVTPGKGIDARETTMVDLADTSVFDLSDLADIHSKLTGTYDWQALAPADLTLTQDPATGALVIGMSESGKAKVDARGADKDWTVYLTLTTKKINGKQTVSITNHADLVHNGEDVLYWSEKSSEASSFGDEAEVKKYVRNSGTGKWTQNLRAEVDEDGNLTKSTFVYRVEFYAHNGYHGIPMIPVVDHLPEGVEFVGFVNEADADTGDNASKQDKQLGNGVIATFNADDNTVTVSTNGANLSQGTRVNAYFAVRIADSEADVPIVNTVSNSSATITPTDGYPIAVAKMDEKNPNKVIDDANARFELVDDADKVVVSDIFVKDGLLRTEVDGVVKGVKVAKPGTYTLREVVPPTGYVKSEETLTFVVTADSVPEAQTFYNTPNPASVRVGDYVWIDKNHDGLQDSTDEVVPGVELKIEKVGSDGTTVTPVTTGVNGMPITNQVTDEQGEYHFELLPLLEDGEKYRVTVVDIPDTLDGYVPTTVGDGNGAGADDSSTGFAETTDPLAQDKAEDLTLDFGFVKPYVQVGDYVWIDVNKNGTQEADDDVVLPGVKLAIYGPDGVTKVTKDVYGDPIVDQVTDAEGKYLFDNLPVLAEGESYTVKIVQDDPDTITALKGLEPTTPGNEDGTGDGDKDSSDWTATSTLPLTEHQAEDMTLDFGFIRLAVSVGDYVWVDTDRDGSQGDPTDEPGIPGVLLEVYGPDGEKVTKDADGKNLPVVRTDEDGKYSFDNLPALENPEDSYTVKIVQDDEDTKKALAPYVPTKPGNEDGTGDGAEDSSDWEAASTKDLTTEGSHDPTLDFGFVLKYVSVGDYVWIDRDGKGQQDPGETPVKDVELKIELVEDGKPASAVTDVWGVPVGTTLTDAKGHYEFSYLPVLKAGQKYRVSIVKESLPTTLDNFVPTKALAADGDTTIDSETWVAENIGILDGTDTAFQSEDPAHVGDDPTLDFGFREKKVSVGNTVWIDTDEDGVRGPGEELLEGVTLVITGPDGDPVTDVYGNPVEPVVTDDKGHYEFSDLPALPPGEHYTVKVDYEKSPILEEKNLVPTNPGDRGDDTDPSKDYSHTDFAVSEDLTEDGDEDPTLDFGFRNAKVSVGDYVWVDVNRDGLQDSSDIAIKGVVLKLTGPDGNPVTDVFGNEVATATTDGKGFYEFTNLPVLPAGKSYTVSIVQEDPSTVEALAAYVPTTPGNQDGTGDGAEDSSDWEAASTKDLTKDGSHDPTLDFGFVEKYVSVGDYVWIDRDRKGTQDKGETPVKDVELKIELVEDGKSAADVTDVWGVPVGTTHADADGKYEFSYLPVLKAGQKYRVSIVKLPSTLDNFIPTITTPDNGEGADDSSTDTSDSQLKLDGTVAPGKPKDRAHVGEDPTLDFGFIEKSVSVGNTVWYDKDEDGKREEGEPLLEGVTLVVTGPDGKPVTDVYGNPVKPVVTNDKGHYEFKDLPALPPGKHYTVTVDYEKSPILEELNLVPTNPGNRGGDTDPSKDYSHTDSAESKDLTEDGDNDPTLDFGFRKAKVSVGDYVWIDVNRDGLQDSTDIAIKGVVLKLTGPDGNPVKDVFGNDVATTTTNRKGFYEFKNLPVLPAGKSYTVSIVKNDPSTVEALKGLVVTKAGAGSDKTVDSSTDSAISWMDLSKDGSHDPTLDFGFQRAVVKVGNYVWLDKDRDGKQDKKEPGIEGVRLKLTGPDGKPVRDVNGKIVKPVRTDESGYYEFADLPVLEPGQSYTVTLQKNKSKKALKGLKATVAEKGSDKSVDSSTKTSVSWKDLTVHGAEDMTLDFGFYTGDLDSGNVDNPGDDEDDNTVDPDDNGTDNGTGDDNVTDNVTDNGTDDDNVTDNGTGGSTTEPDDGGLLPNTGAEVSLWVIALGLLLVAGGAMLVRRRREI